MSLLHLVSVTTAAQLAAEPFGDGDRDQTRRARPDSRTSITVLVPGPEDHLGRRGDVAGRARPARALRPCRGRAPRRPAAGVRPGRRSAPGRAPVRSPRCRPPRAPHGMPIAMIGAEVPEQDPRCLGLVHVRQASRTARRAGIEPIGQPAMPIRSLLARGATLRAGASSRPDHEIRARARHLDRGLRLSPVGGPRDHAVRARADAVEAGSGPRGRSTAQRPSVGQRRPSVGDRLAVGVAQRRRRSGAARSSCRARPVGDPRADRLRPHLRAALEASRRTRPRAAPRSRATPCTGRRPRSRSRPSPRFGRPTDVSASARPSRR